MTLGRQIALTAALLVLAIYLFGVTDIDLWVQDLLYDTQTHQWILDRNLQPYRWIFYDGVKVVLVLFALSMLLSLLLGRKSALVQRYRQGILIVVLSALIVPTAASSLKKVTNMPCPKHSIRYGGAYPHTVVWEHYPKALNGLSPTQCWPAGHASGGFALLSLFFLFKRRKNQYRALLFALGMGWVMGGYKMLIGDHYFSHTWITMLLSWLLIVLITKGVRTLSPEDKSAHL